MPRTLHLSDLQRAVVRQGFYRVLGNRVCVDLDHDTVLTTDEAMRRVAAETLPSSCPVRS